MERVFETPMRGGIRHHWRNGDLWDRSATQVIVGERDGDWYARWDGPPGTLRPGAALYTGPRAEHYALSTARRWMRTVGGTWRET